MKTKQVECLALLAITDCTHLVANHIGLSKNTHFDILYHTMALDCGSGSSLEFARLGNTDMIHTHVWE